MRFCERTYNIVAPSFTGAIAMAWAVWADDEDGWELSHMVSIVREGTVWLDEEGTTTDQTPKEET